MSDAVRQVACPQFRSAFIGWYAVQGYCVPRHPSDRPMIPSTAAFESQCSTPRFQECPRFIGVHRFVGDASVGPPREDQS